MIRYGYDVRLIVIVRTVWIVKCAHLYIVYGYFLASAATAAASRFAAVGGTVGGAVVAVMVGARMGVAAGRGGASGLVLIASSSVREQGILQSRPVVLASRY